jgi:hypothetical protein
MHLILTLFMLSSAWATSPNFESVYKDLTVEEKDVTGGRLGGRTLRKEAGGLTCEASTPVVPHPTTTYHCALSKGMNAAKIYAAMGAPEKDVTPEGRLGSATFAKTAGPLTCRKSSVVVPNAKPRFSCELTRATAQPEEEEYDTGSSSAQ